MYPDLLQMLNAHIDRSQVNDCILDSEVVAFDRASNRILPFQSIQHRKRTDVEVADITVEVCIYLFDVMYLNGESLMKKPLVERREILRRTIEEVPGKMQMVQFQNTTSFEDIEQLLMDSVKIGCEGLMVKSLKERAEYEPSKRSFNWLKLKKDYIDNNTQLGDSVDLVPIGADLGTGKRTGVYGSFLLAAYDETNSEFQSVCKIGTGFSDEFLQEAYKTLSEWELQRPRRDYRTNQQMDVWFEAKVVWEVKAADLSLSSVHMAACGKIAENKGIALRFPRFMKTRPDKSPEQATSTDQLADMYQSQSAVTHLQPEAAEEYDDEELI
jgi:DNA ligase-1